MLEAKKQKTRPVIKLPLTNIEKLLEVLAGIGVLSLFVSVFVAWESLPERIPTHFGFSGIPDGWGGKGSLVALPIVVLVLYVFLSRVSRYPHLFNYPWKITEENAKVQYQYARYMMILTKVEIVWFFAYIQGKTMQVALGDAAGLGIFFLPVSLVIVFGTIGIYIYKASKYK